MMINNDKTRDTSMTRKECYPCYIGDMVLIFYTLRDLNVVRELLVLPVDDYTETSNPTRGIKDEFHVNHNHPLIIVRLIKKDLPVFQPNG